MVKLTKDSVAQQWAKVDAEFAAETRRESALPGVELNNLREYDGPTPPLVRSGAYGSSR